MAVSKNAILPIKTFTIFYSTEKNEIFLDNENVIYIFKNIFILQTTTALHVHACFLSIMNTVHMHAAPKRGSTGHASLYGFS